MIPVVALVGRPNVGKSTLFNRLTRTRDALVADFPGLTRDRKYGRAHVDEQEFIVIDTGGIDGDNASQNAADGGRIEGRMAEQSLLAIEEADVVFFLVDARSGIIPSDKAIAGHLRSRQKPTFVVANKTDGLDEDIAILDFYMLGLGDIYPIAASHGRGVGQLLEKAFLPWLNTKQAEKGPLEQSDFTLSPEDIFDNPKVAMGQDETTENFDPRNLPIKLAIVGRPNVGKSTLTNRILGEDRVVVYDIPGTTRDSVYIPMERNERQYILIDTAGVRKRAKVTETVEKFSVIKTLQAIESANVVMLVIDAREGITDQDLSMLGFILNCGRPLVIVINKWDGLSQDIKSQVKEVLDFRLGFVDFARIHFISALHGSGVGNLYGSINEAYDCSTRRVNTAMLTQIMNMATSDHQPPLVRGRRVKLKYAHAGGYNPLIVMIHGNQLKRLPESYKRYLMNYFRRALKIIGSPVHIQFKEGENPYANKRNPLTPNQQRKRKRLITHIKRRE